MIAFRALSDSAMVRIVKKLLPRCLRNYYGSEVNPEVDDFVVAWIDIDPPPKNNKNPKLRLVAPGAKYVITCNEDLDFLIRRDDTAIRFPGALARLGCRCDLGPGEYMKAVKKEAQDRIPKEVRRLFEENPKPKRARN